MSSPMDGDETKEPEEEFENDARAGALHTEERPANKRPNYKEIVNNLIERRKRLLKQDTRGWTPLFYAAKEGDEEAVKEIIFRFRGTGMLPPRLALIATKDHAGLTAADVAEQNGHEEIARLLHGEQGRMEWFE